jgi:hypothetical protein
MPSLAHRKDDDDKLPASDTEPPVSDVFASQPKDHDNQSVNPRNPEDPNAVDSGMDDSLKAGGASDSATIRANEPHPEERAAQIDAGRDAVQETHELAPDTSAMHTTDDMIEPVVIDHEPGENVNVERLEAANERINQLYNRGIINRDTHDELREVQSILNTVIDDLR